MASSRSVAVTGGLGNLGTKLLLHLAGASPCALLIGLDARAPSSEELKALQAAAAQNRTGAAFNEAQVRPPPAVALRQSRRWN